MEELSIAGNTISPDRVERILTEYARIQMGTVRWYDFSGGDHLAASDGVSLDDLGRMTLINPDLTGGDSTQLLEHGAHAPWHLVPHDARLEDAELNLVGGLYDAALALYDHFLEIPGIGDAKASKLLHLKRPWLYPILDTQVMTLYEIPAMKAVRGSVRTDRSTSHWEAIRLDLVNNADAFGRIAAALSHGDENAQMLSRLPSLRLLDIVAWREGTKSR